MTTQGLCVYFERMKSKYSRILSLSVQVIRFDTNYGRLKWKVTDLARYTKMSRSRIYEVLGQKKSVMLENSLSILLDDLYGLSTEKRLVASTKERFHCFMQSRKTVIDHPELLSFYFQNRNAKDRIGQIIREKEKLFLEWIFESTGIKNPTDLLLVRTTIHGISLAPFIDEDTALKLMSRMTEILKK